MALKNCCLDKAGFHVLVLSYWIVASTCFLLTNITSEYKEGLFWIGIVFYGVGIVSVLVMAGHGLYNRCRPRQERYELVDDIL